MNDPLRYAKPYRGALLAPRMGRTDVWTPDGRGDYVCQQAGFCCFAQAMLFVDELDLEPVDVLLDKAEQKAVSQ
jgi:hypothetical protein